MQIEEIPSISFKERTEKMKEKLVTEPHEICIERARLITESYKTTKGEDPIIRFAKAMEHYLTHMTIKIWDDEVIVGNRATKYSGAPLFPEVRIDLIESDYKTYDTRSLHPLLLSNEEKTYIGEELVPYWKFEEETVVERFKKKIISDSTLQELTEGGIMVGVDAEFMNGIGHFFPGHRTLLKYGINGLIEKAEKKLVEFSDEVSKTTFLQSVIILCNAVKQFIQRFSELAKKKAESELNSTRQSELYEIADICRNISGNPPSSFKEAIQLIFFNFLVCGLEDGGHGISVGRVDQELYPFYLKDKNEGKISDEETQFLVECFYIKMNPLWNYQMAMALNGGMEGPATGGRAENLTIGGVDRDGNDATTELSYIMLDAYTHLRTVQPTFSIRIHKKTPDDFLDKVGQSIKSGACVALFNDDVMIDGLVKLGFTLEDAREYAPVGCVEPQHPFKSFASTSATMYNIVKYLELALTNGIDMVTKLDYGFRNKKKITSYEDLWDAFKEQTSYYIKYNVLGMEAADAAIAELNPQPFLSATTEDCLDKGLDVTRGGAIYNFTGATMVGLATVADSLAVIKKVVFEDNLLSLEELVEMLMKNYRGIYRGKKGREWKEIFINKIPKYGNDNDYVDSIATDVVELFCNESLKHTNYRGGKFNPGFFTNGAEGMVGMMTGASADGRRSQARLSNGVCPTTGMEKNGPTAVLNSVKKFDHALATNGNALTISIHPNTLNSEVFRSLIQTYFQPDGGFHVQFNVFSKDTLIDAQSNPEKYGILPIRIAGYSVDFIALSKKIQNEVISRTIH